MLLLSYFRLFFGIFLSALPFPQLCCLLQMFRKVAVLQFCANVFQQFFNFRIFPISPSHSMHFCAFSCQNPSPPQQCNCLSPHPSFLPIGLGAFLPRIECSEVKRIYHEAQFELLSGAMRRSLCPQYSTSRGAAFHWWFAPGVHSTNSGTGRDC